MSQTPNQPSDSSIDATTPPDTDPPLQGEGNISAARRHRKSVEAFIDAGKVQPAADKAAPADATQAQELRDAEAEGRAPARR